jgi:tetratricopeptide (TPR) repeat protein
MKTARGIRDAKDTIPGYYAVVSARVYIRQLSEGGKYEEALTIAKEAMAIRPDDVDLALSEADTYLKMKNFIKTKELLEAVIKKQPDNANLYYVIGNIYDQLAKDTSNTAEVNEENFKLSVSYYVQAIEKRADYFEALFNLGTVFNNRAVDRFAVAQKLPYGDPRADALFAEVDELFRTALPYLETAHAVNPNDGDPIRMLYSIYLRLRMKEQSDAMKIKVDALKR